MVQNMCYTCGQIFSRKGNLRRHIDNVHKNITSIKCETCGKIVSRKDNLENHINLVHKYSHNSLQKNETLPYKRKIESDHHTPVETNEAFKRSKYTVDQLPKEIAPQTKNEYYEDLDEDEKYFIQRVGIGPDDHLFPWKHPFTCLISGPTGCGKTVFAKRFVNNINRMMDPIPERIIWYYSEYQTVFGTVNNVEFVEGLPDIDVLNPYERHLVIIDDQMTENNKDIVTLFTKKSHHRNISVMYLVQNLFYQTKEHRNISLNAHYIVLFRNRRDSSQVDRLGKQIFPGKSKWDLGEAYRKATSKPYGYLLVDLKPETKDYLQLRTDIFPGQIQRVFLPA